MPKPVRRIITANQDGKSVIYQDSNATNVDSVLGIKDFGMTNLWITHSSPLNINEDNPLESPFPLEPLRNGTLFRIVDFPPEATYLAALKKQDVSKILAQFKLDQQPQEESVPHPFMHKTSTIDYGIVLSGEIYLILDESETLLKQGDVVIQRGTNHAWSNRSDQLCRVAFVLINGQEQ